LDYKLTFPEYDINKTSLWNRKADFMSASPGRDWEFFSSPPHPDRLWKPPIQWVPEVLSLGVKLPGREADHSPPSSAEVKE
jgi:hypothetical protein